MAGVWIQSGDPMTFVDYMPYKWCVGWLFLEFFVYRYCYCWTLSFACIDANDVKMHWILWRARGMAFRVNNMAKKCHELCLALLMKLFCLFVSHCSWSMSWRSEFLFQHYWNGLLWFSISQSCLKLSSCLRHKRTFIKCS